MGTIDLLGSLENEIMEVMWAKGEATVRQIVDVLNPQRRLAYTTVMTVMNNLVKKGLLTRVAGGKAYAYRVTLSREAFLDRKAQEAVSETLERFGDLAIARFIEAAARIRPEYLQRLQELSSSEPDPAAGEEQP